MVGTRKSTEISRQMCSSVSCQYFSSGDLSNSSGIRDLILWGWHSKSLQTHDPPKLQ